jgi:CBS domain containing-hemolysin-like protein
VSSPQLIFGLLLVGLMVVSTTANVALRGVSRVRLAERLERMGLPPALLNQLFDRRGELLLATSTVRISAILMLVLLAADVAGIRPARAPLRAYGLAFLASMGVTLVMGVAIPNAWARYAGEPFVAASIRLLLGLRYLLYPLVAFLRLFDVLVRRLAGVPADDGQEAEAQQIEKEILGVVSEAESAGAVHEQDAEMIESVIQFRDTQAGQIMTPRTEIVAVPATATLFEVKETIAHEGHSRLPVYGDNIDDIKGVLYAKDILQVADDAHFDPLALMRKVPFVPETKRVADLLGELRLKQVHIAIVLDEYGGTAGLVTIEDIIEEIIGEIADEYESRPPETIRRINERTLELDARVRIDELNDELRLQLPDEDDYDTVGGFLFSKMGRIPAAGEEFRYENVLFKVLAAEERKINRVRVEVLSASPSAAE